MIKVKQHTRKGKIVRAYSRKGSAAYNAKEAWAKRWGKNPRVAKSKMKKAILKTSTSMYNVGEHHQSAKQFNKDAERFADTNKGGMKVGRRIIAMYAPGNFFKSHTLKGNKKKA